MEKIENKKYWVWLSLLKTIGVKKKNNLLEKYISPEKIYNLKIKELEKIEYLKKENIEEILNENIKASVERHIKYINEKNIKIITIKDKDYPQNLKQIYDPPICLYIKGNNEILNNKNIAIIGCRNCSEYGKKAAKYFSYNLAKKNHTIISGLAKGIDSYSHIGTIKAKGKTIAVIGNGLDKIYPEENKWLYNEILKNNGAIITEYPLRYKTFKNEFSSKKQNH